MHSLLLRAASGFEDRGHDTHEHLDQLWVHESVVVGDVEYVDGSGA